MQRIVPNVWCQGNAAEVGGFYARIFPEASSETTAYYPSEGLPDFQREFAGRELVVDVSIRGFRIRLINAGNEFRPTPALSFLVNIDPANYGGQVETARGEVDRMWAELSDGGTVRMELGQYPYSPYYGWIEDRYGVNWQFMLTDSAAEERLFVLPDLLFTGSEPRARAAIDFYTGLIQDSAIGNVFPHPEQPGALAFADFTLAGQVFAAMDGGADHEFDFTPGLSLEISCDDQAEIDRLWEALSAVPEAEQCGWCVDRFGVNWQVVPANLGDLMERPGAYERMLGMKKLIIDDL